MDDVWRTLVLLRHGKSDWSGTGWTADRDRPLAARGRRQAPRAGRWLAEHGPTIDLALVSPARRAADTWALVRDELPEQPPERLDERVYSFDGGDLLDVVRDMPGAVRTAAVVGHNPALEELLHALTGARPEMKTSALAVVTWPGSWRETGDGSARLRAHGRPPPERDLRG